VEASAKDTDRDFFLGPEEAKTYGLVDSVLVKPPVDEEEADRR
jgi:ATP-dependent Clp protease protease subunit